MAEIEHFVDPQSKSHERFEEVKDIKLTLLNRDTQLSGKTTPDILSIGEAIEKKIVDNQTLGYFLARIQLFLLKIGIDPTKIRFRQHMANEMAHYAADCWDAELQTSFGWIECVGCADRSAYDLSVHAKKTGAPLVVRVKDVRTVEEWHMDLDKKKFGPKFKKDAKAVEAALDALTDDLKEKLSLDLKKDGKMTIDVEAVAGGKVELDGDLIKLEKKTVTKNTREFTPNVIEPSFGIGRIFYALSEHVYWTREGDDARGVSFQFLLTCPQPLTYEQVLSFPPAVAPTKVLLVPLSKHPDFKPAVTRLSRRLRQLGVSNRVDDSGVSIGRRYSRNDELGTPYGLTVDFQSVGLYEP
jgi:glycyl-tRNA synthetase